MTKGQLERFAGFILHKYMPKSVSGALFDIVSGQLDKKSTELSNMIIDMASGIDRQDLDKIVRDTTGKLKEAYKFFSS